jgi:NADPH2:quinone reductase
VRAVRYDRFEGIDGLGVEQRPDPVAAPGEVVVRVLASGINPGSLSALRGAPYVPNRDLAGEVVALGDGVRHLAVGDPVLGSLQDWWAHAELVAVPAVQLAMKPAALSWEVAGSLYTGGLAALASVQAVRPEPGELVVVSGASGAVGLTAAQLARNAGATVIGLAGPDRVGWLEARGITAVTYGPGQDERVRTAAAGRTIDAFIDAAGAGSVALALDLGVATGRINTVVDFATAQQAGVSTRGTRDAGGTPALAELADLAASGTLEFPVAATFPLAEVQQAYRAVTARRLFGRVVLHPQQ